MHRAGSNARSSVTDNAWASRLNAISALNSFVLRALLQELLAYAHKGAQLFAQFVLRHFGQIASHICGWNIWSHSWFLDTATSPTAKTAWTTLHNLRLIWPRTATCWGSASAARNRPPIRAIPGATMVLFVMITTISMPLSWLPLACSTLAAQFSLITRIALFVLLELLLLELA